MKIKITFFFFLLAALFTGCSTTSIYPGIVGFMKNLDHFDVFSRQSNHVLGSPYYVKYINEFSKVSGDSAALKKVMTDIEKDYALIGNNPENDLRLYKLVSMLIYKNGYVDKEIHYLRNKLNIVPESLDEMLKLNSTLPPSKQWRLVSVGGSIYHMQGEEGIYNLKFVSSSGFCEAVYNKYGILLTEDNDPVNMGTFNFGAGIPVADAHKRFDIDPYLEWGNTSDSPQKGSAVINFGINMANDLYNRNKELVNDYRLLIMGGSLRFMITPSVQPPGGERA